VIRQPRAVLFDLDDTLYAERRFALSGFAAVARATALDAGVDAGRVFRILVAAFRCGERAIAFQRLCATLGWSEARVPALVDVYRRHQPNLRMPQLTLRTLAALKAGWRLAIVTNGPAAIQTAKVHALGLSGQVDTIVYAARCGVGGEKPAPEPFITAARHLGVLPSRCVFVGDDPLCDVAGARRVGMKTIRVRQGLHAGATLGLHEEADAVTDSLRDVPRLAGAVLGETEALCA
jgi:putative hydrolase of the HAD superfamily